MTSRVESTLPNGGGSSPSPRHHHAVDTTADVTDAHNSYIRSNQDVEIGALRTQLAFYVGYFNRHQKDIIRRSCSPENIDGMMASSPPTSQNNGVVQSDTIFDDLHTLRLALHLAEDRVESLRRAQANAAADNKRGRDELLKEIDLLSDENDSMLEEQQGLQLRIGALERELEEAKLLGGGEPVRATMGAVRRGATAILQMTEAAARSALESAWSHECLSIAGSFYEGQAYLPNGGGVSNPPPSSLFSQVLWFKGMLPPPTSVSAPTASSLSAMVAWGTKEWVTLASYQPPKPSVSSPGRAYQSSSLHQYAHLIGGTPGNTPTTAASQQQQQHHSPAGVGTRQRILHSMREEDATKRERAAEDVQYYVDSRAKGHLLGPDSPMYEPYYSLAHMTPIPLNNSGDVRRSVPQPSLPQQQQQSISSPAQHGNSGDVSGSSPRSRYGGDREASTTSPQVKSQPFPYRQQYSPRNNTPHEPSASPIANRPPAAAPGRHSAIDPSIAKSPSYTTTSYSSPHQQAKKEHIGVRDLRIEALMKERLEAAAAVREAQWGTRTAARINEGVQRCELDSRASQSISRTEDMIEESLRRYRAELAQKDEDAAVSPPPAKVEQTLPSGPTETEEERAERILREKEEEELKEKLFERVTKAKNELLVLERISRETGDPTMKQRFQRQMKAMHEYLLEDDFATGVSVVLEQEDAAEKSAMMSTAEDNNSSPAVQSPPVVSKQRRASQQPPSVVVHKQPFMLSASDAKKFQETSVAKQQQSPGKKGAFTIASADTPRRRGGPGGIATSPSRSPKRRPTKSASSPASKSVAPPRPATPSSPKPSAPRVSSSPEAHHNNNTIPSDASVATTDCHVRALLREAQDELQREALRLRSSTSCVLEDGEEDISDALRNLSPVPHHSS